MLDRMFNVENKFWTFANKMADVVILEIAWLLTSLPIVTIGAASTAFWHVLLQIAEDQEGKVLRTYFRAFAKNFPLGTKLWLCQLGFGLFLVFDITACLRIKGIWPIFLFGIFAGVAFLWLLVSVFLYPLAGRFDFSFRKIVSNSLFMTFRHLPHGFCMLLTTGLALAGSYYIPYAVIVLPALALYLNAMICNWIFSLYMEKEEDGEEDGMWAETQGLTAAGGGQE